MRGLLLRTVLPFALLLAPAQAGGDDTLPPPRVLPDAQPAPPAVRFYYLPPPTYYPRVSAYAHWQYRGVDTMGQWRPRVLYLPHTAFYLYNGAPFPWAPTRTLEFMPYAADSNGS